MRVIAGTAKGTRLAPVPGGTRPLSDRAREGLFASLGDRVKGARCADLFAGTGAVGIEALSRGAASCDFVDSGAGAIRAIRENLSRARFAGAGPVHRSDVRRFLARDDAGPYDVAFLDPPYTFPQRALAAALEGLVKRLTPGGTFVLTRPSRNPKAVVPLHYVETKRLVYGDALVLVYLEER
ncbi:MAG TPA: RsmD family RNA methyltransferase [Actinomycetota bacterium]|jgi:16S rRNA (guanine966-N2)-methyltransferase|nr:RsmD family RNA methyltransferase [Actinomycetota bacterium]